MKKKRTKESALSLVEDCKKIATKLDQQIRGVVFAKEAENSQNKASSSSSSSSSKTASSSSSSAQLISSPLQNKRSKSKIDMSNFENEPEPFQVVR